MQRKNKNLCLKARKSFFLTSTEMCLTASPPKIYFYTMGSWLVFPSERPSHSIQRDTAFKATRKGDWCRGPLDTCSGILKTKCTGHVCTSRQRVRGAQCPTCFSNSIWKCLPFTTSRLKQGDSATPKKTCPVQGRSIRARQIRRNWGGVTRPSGKSSNFCDVVKTILFSGVQALCSSTEVQEREEGRVGPESRDQRFTFTFSWVGFVQTGSCSAMAQAHTHDTLTSGRHNQE